MFNNSQEKTGHHQPALFLNDKNYGSSIREGNINVMLQPKINFIHWRRRGFWVSARMHTWMMVSLCHQMNLFAIAGTQVLIIFTRIVFWFLKKVCKLCNVYLNLGWFTLAAGLQMLLLWFMHQTTFYLCVTDVVEKYGVSWTANSSNRTQAHTDERIRHSLHTFCCFRLLRLSLEYFMVTGYFFTRLISQILPPTA